MKPVLLFLFWYKISKCSIINTFSCHVETWITNPSAHVPTHDIKMTWNYTMQKQARNNRRIMIITLLTHHLGKKSSNKKGTMLLFVHVLYYAEKVWKTVWAHANAKNVTKPGYFEKSCKCCNYRCNLNKQQQVFQRLGSPLCKGICVHYSQVNWSCVDKRA